MTVPTQPVSGGYAWFLRTAETAVTFFIGALAVGFINELHAGKITNTDALYNALWAAAVGALLATLKQFTGLTLSNVWGAAPRPIGKSRV